MSCVFVCLGRAFVRKSVHEGPRVYDPDTINGLDWDDLVVNPIASLPKGLSPHNVDRVISKQGEKLPEFYCNLNRPNETDDDSDFQDSDFEIDQDDDDLSEDCVDDQVPDEGVATGKKIQKGKKAQKGKQIHSIVDDMSTDDEDLQLPDSDGEGEGGLRFINFRDQDVGNPIFKVGMLFESVEVLRKAVTEYSVKQRVDIWFSRNEQKRLKAHCADGCPWLLYGSVDNRSNGMVIKTYQGTHNCQRKWVVKRCTSRWLAEKYLESFRADQKMTLANFARVVQKE